MIRSSVLAASAAIALSTTAQTVEWLNSAPTGWALNYSLPSHFIRTSPNGSYVLAARLSAGGFAYGLDVYGTVTIEGVEPATGLPLAGCMLEDSVLVQSALVDDNGVAYVGGSFIGDLQLCSGSITSGTGSGWDADLFLLAFDLNTGLVLWSRNLSIAHPQAVSVPVITQDNNGTVWYATEEFHTGKVTSIDALGNDLVTWTIDGLRTLSGVSFDPWNNVYMTGSTEDSAGPLAFGGLSVPVPEPYMMFVLRMNATGQGSWARLAHDITFQMPDVACDPFGNAFVSGGLMDSTTFGTIHFNGPNWVNDVFVAKVDSLGDFLWGAESAPNSATITGDFARGKHTGIASDGSGNVFLLGTLRGTTDWGNGVVSDGITLGTSCLGVVAFDGNGTPLWARTSLPGGAVVAHTISSDAAGVLYFSSNILGSFTLAPFTTNGGGAQAFSDGRINALSTGVGPGRTGSVEVGAWPSPFRETFRLHAPAGLRLRVWNAQGALVFEGTTTAAPLGEGWPAGVYALTVGDGSTASHLRVVKE